MRPCPDLQIPARRRRARRNDPVPRAMSSCCCSTASTGTCSAATAARSSTRRTSTGSPASGPSASPPTSPGSLPCMPARHDILCGSLDFLWRPWGSIEIWEEPITAQLRRAGVTTMLVSDHPHLFEVGGENYHTDFSAWDYVRGHEGDPWRTYPDPSYIGTPALPARGGGWFWRDRMGWADAGDGPTTARARSSAPRRISPDRGRCGPPRGWLRDGAPDDAPFLLFVDEFDPHEPFDTPEPWAGRYDPDWDGELLIWPPYDVGAVAQGRLSEREGRQIRANYGAKLSMIDHWAGEVFAALTERGLWESTAVIVCTDHGHYLGEKDIWGKPGRHAVRAARSYPAAGALARGGRRHRVRRAHDQRRHQRHHRRRVRGARGRRRGWRTVTSLVPLLRGDGGPGAGVGHRRRLRELGAGDGRPPQVRPRRGRGELPPLHVVQPLVDHARARAGGRGPPARARPAGPARLHAGVRGPGDPPALRARRPPALLGGAQRGRRALPLRPRRRPGRGREPGRRRRVEADMVELLRVALRSVDAPGEQLERLGIA